jgi:anti-sigma B factor antagonist
MTENANEPARIASLSGQRATVETFGEIDISTSPILRSRVAECLSQGCSEITVDMSHLEFIDSSGIQVLVWLLKELRAVDGRLIIRHPPAIAEKVLAISGLTPYLTFTETGSRETLHPEDPA